VTSRNVVASHWRDRGRQQRNQHRVVDLRPPDAPDDALLAREEQGAVAEALTRLSDRERETLLAHEVSGRDTRSLAEELGSTAGAVAAQLNRTRARLRVEYLSSTCWPSSGSSRRPSGAGRSSWRSRAPTGAGSARSMLRVTCWSATSAHG
jgi:hypothetical protein